MTLIFSKVLWTMGKAFIEMIYSSLRNWNWFLLKKTNLLIKWRYWNNFFQILSLLLTKHYLAAIQWHQPHYLWAIPPLMLLYVVGHYFAQKIDWAVEGCELQRYPRLIFIQRYSFYQKTSTGNTSHWLWLIHKPWHYPN